MVDELEELYPTRVPLSRAEGVKAAQEEFMWTHSRCVECARFYSTLLREEDREMHAEKLTRAGLVPQEDGGLLCLSCDDWINS